VTSLHRSSCHMSPWPTAAQESQGTPSSPRRDGSGTCGALSGTTRRPSGSKGKISHAVRRDNGIRPSASAAVIACA
jgi:hypothetical protein